MPHCVVVYFRVTEIYQEGHYVDTSQKNRIWNRTEKQNIVCFSCSVSIILQFCRNPNVTIIFDVKQISHPMLFWNSIILAPCVFFLNRVNPSPPPPPPQSPLHTHPHFSRFIYRPPSSWTLSLLIHQSNIMIATNPTPPNYEQLYTS